MPLQDIKDTFYTTLRDRVAAANPVRTLVLRGVVRPGVLVAENELPTTAVDGIVQPGAFILRWIALTVDPTGPAHLRLEIRYATDGTAGASGMDRGRALATMDDELQTAINTAPQSAELNTQAEVAGGGALTATDRGTRMFWSRLVFGPVTMKAGRLERTATVEVFGYE